MSHARKAGQAPDQASSGRQTGAAARARTDHSQGTHGAGSANVYALTGLEPEPVDSKARAEWHRVSWHELERRRRALERASGSAPNLAKG